MEKQLNTHNVTLRTCGLPQQFVSDTLPQVALCGRSNVGKSSLVNTLLGRKKLARVSGEPGKTITVNYYNVDNALYLVDLPGYGYARRSASDQKRWRALTDRYFQNNENLRLVIQLIDLKVGPTADDDTMLQWLFETKTPYVIVATKADKLNVTQRTVQLQRLQEDQMVVPGTPVIPFSSLKGYGADVVWEAILSVLIPADNASL